MPERSSKKKNRKKPLIKTIKKGDENEVNTNIVDVTGGNNKQVINEKNPAAVALGRLGGLKGGKARANKLTRDERSEIARKAANARWSK